MRLCLTARGVADLPGDPAGIGSARELLVGRAATLAAWYEQLAELVARPGHRPPVPLEPPRLGPIDLGPDARCSYYGIWLAEHLDHLVEHLVELAKPALSVAEARRHPWWR